MVSLVFVHCYLPFVVVWLSVSLRAFQMKKEWTFELAAVDYSYEVGSFSRALGRTAGRIFFSLVILFGPRKMLGTSHKVR